MSVEYSSSYGTVAPMSSSASSTAEETPDSEYALSVLEFAQQQVAGAQSECGHPRLSRRKRRRDFPYQDEQQPSPRQCCSQQQHQHTVDNRAAYRSQTRSSKSRISPAECQQATFYVAIHGCLVQWCYRLQALQPKCIITKDVLHRTFDLFHRYRQAVQAAPSPEGQGATAVHLAACLWIASKNDGNRACVPSRTLLTRAVSVCPEELTQAELTVCCVLQWNIFNSQVVSAN